MSYQKFRNEINRRSKVNPCGKLLRAIYDNWVCTEREDKRSFKEIGANQHLQEKTRAVMAHLGIEENVSGKGGFAKTEEIKFSPETMHMFAVSQHDIARKNDYHSR
jgi:Cu/Ag efflux pump CusA